MELKQFKPTADPCVKEDQNKSYQSFAFSDFLSPYSNVSFDSDVGLVFSPCSFDLAKTRSSKQPFAGPRRS